MPLSGRNRRGHSTDRNLDTSEQSSSMAATVDKEGTHQQGPHQDNATVQALQTLMEKMTSMENNMKSYHQEMKSNHQEMKSLIDRKTAKVKDDILVQLGLVTSRIESMEMKMARVDEFMSGKTFETDKCIMIYHLSQSKSETESTLQQKVEEVIARGLDLPGVEVVRVKRCYGSPGPVKVELTSANIKVEVLRAKQQLKGKREYSQLYIRAAKSHEERLLELNMNTLLDYLDIRDRFRYTGSGRLVQRELDESELSGAVGGRRGRGFNRTRNYRVPMRGGGRGSSSGISSRPGMMEEQRSSSATGSQADD